ncbi:uncharacterized protein [Polyergus mexicanus]|uniref:uncharacterized protein isoform X2 n=1 Tax=Polyergus mexicanus TaxID=615972 RepID=UPI0038B463A9
MSKRGLPSKQLPPDSSSQRQESPDLLPQEQQSPDSSLQWQEPADLLPQQQQSPSSFSQQQSSTDSSLQQQPSHLPSRQNEAQGLSSWPLQQQNIPDSYIGDQQQNFHQLQSQQTLNFQEQLLSSQQQQSPGSFSQQQSSTDSSLQQQPPHSFSWQNEARGLPSWQLQPSSYIGDQQDFHQLQSQETLNFQEQLLSSQQQQSPGSFSQQQSSTDSSLQQQPPHSFSWQNEARGLPSWQLQPSSYIGDQQDFHQLQSQETLNFQEQLLSSQQQQLPGSFSQQQSSTDSSLQQQPSHSSSQNEARGLPSWQLQQNIISGSYIGDQQQGFHQLQSQQTLNFQRQLSSSQQRPSRLPSWQNEARRLPSWQLQQNIISGSYIGDQQQGFHQLQSQQTSNFQGQQNLYMSYPYAGGYYQYPSRNVERNQEWQPHYSYGVLNSNRQSVQEASYSWRSPRPRLQQSTYNQSRHQISHSLPQQQQVPQYSLQQHQVTRAQQLQPQISHDLLHQVPANPVLQQSTFGQQVPPVLSQQQQQYSFFQQHEMRDQQQRMGGQRHRIRGPQQQGIQTQSHQYFEAEVDNANYDEQTQVVEQDNEKAKSNTKQQQQATKNIISALSQLTLKQTSQETEITQKVSSTMKQYQACIPKRQGVKKAEGTHISVLTNMFKIKFNGNFTNAVHYDVDITSTVSSKFPKTLYRKVFEKCRSEHFTNRYPAFDGRKNAYSAKDLPFGSHLETDIKIQDCKKHCDKQCDKHVKIFKIIFKKVANIDLNWIKNLRSGLDEVDRDQTGIQVLDIIMRHGPESQYVNIGRSLFWDLGIKETLTNLTGGLSSARGGFLSAVLGWQMYLNIDVVHKGFITPQKVADLIYELDSEMKRNNENKENNNKAIAKFLKGVKVIYEVPQQSDSLFRLKPRTYHLNGLGPNANEHKFLYNGSDITIRKYFENRYKYILRDPNLPCLSVGAQGKETYLPAELCTVMAGQSVKKLNKIQTSKMITVAAENALKRRQRIKEAFNKINVNIDPTMRQEFRLSVDTEMEKVDARILKAPALKYADAEVPVNNGKWYMKKFVQPMRLKNDEWTIINLDKSHKFVAHHNMCVFMENLIRIAQFVGMQIERPNTKNFKSLDPEKTEEIRNYFENNKALKLIIVVISNSPDTIYNKIKQITELELGVLTQCIKYQNICEDNKSTTTIRNILLKINTKLNGINHILYTRLLQVVIRSVSSIMLCINFYNPEKK